MTQPSLEERGGTIYKPLCCDKAGSAADGEISVQLKQ